MFTHIIVLHFCKMSIDIYIFSIYHLNNIASTILSHLTGLLVAQQATFFVSVLFYPTLYYFSILYRLFAILISKRRASHETIEK